MFVNKLFTGFIILRETGKISKICTKLKLAEKCIQLFKCYQYSYLVGMYEMKFCLIFNILHLKDLRSLTVESSSTD